jgi:hypothetical protein
MFWGIAMRISKAATDHRPRPAAEPPKENAGAGSLAKVDVLKRLDTNGDGKLDRTEFSKSVPYQSADERQRDILSRAFAAAANQAAQIDSEAGFETLAQSLAEPKPAADDSLLQKGLDGIASAYNAVKGFFGDLFGKMKRAASDFISWAGGQLNKATNGFFEKFETKVVREPEALKPSAARARLKETEADEREALEKLKPEDRDSFKAVAAQLDAEPVARLTLRTLLLDGRLPGGNDLVTGKSLLANLSALASQPIADGIDKQDLLADVLAHVADPINVSQEQQNTCGPTSGQVILAAQEPAEYVRVAAGLASPEGSVKLQNGDEIHREADWNDKEADRRSVANRLFQSALMEYANGQFDYSNVKDSRQVSVGPLTVDIPGMLPAELVKLVEGMTGRSYSVTYSLMSDRVSPEFEAALAKAEPGRALPVLVNYSVDGDGVRNTSPHYFLVTGYDAASGMVAVSNPWGREEEVALQELQRHLIAFMPPA